MQDLLAELESSDLSVAEFARQRGIAAHRLYWARRQARTAAADEAESHHDHFAEAIVVQPSEANESAIELVLPSGLMLRLTRDFDEVALRRVLGCLGSC